MPGKLEKRSNLKIKFQGNLEFGNNIIEKIPNIQKIGIKKFKIETYFGDDARTG
jgi:hypothetical protein